MGIRSLISRWSAYKETARKSPDRVTALRRFSYFACFASLTPIAIVLYLANQIEISVIIFKIIGVVFGAFVIDAVILAIGSSFLKLDFEKPKIELIDDAIATIDSKWDLDQIQKKVINRKLAIQEREEASSKRIDEINRNLKSSN